MGSRVFKRMKAAGANKILSATRLIVESGSTSIEVTISGFKIAADKKGKPQAIFETATGEHFYVTGWQKENLLSVLEEEYGSADKIDAMLKAYPQVWRMELSETKAGNPFILTEVLEELEVGKDDGSGQNPGAEGEHGASVGQA